MPVQKSGFLSHSHFYFLIIIKELTLSLTFFSIARNNILVHLKNRSFYSSGCIKKAIAQRLINVIVGARKGNKLAAETLLKSCNAHPRMSVLRVFRRHAPKIISFGAVLTRVFYCFPLQ